MIRSERPKLWSRIRDELLFNGRLRPPSSLKTPIKSCKSFQTCPKTVTSDSRLEFQASSSAWLISKYVLMEREYFAPIFALQYYSPPKWLPRAVWVSSECDWLISKEAAKYPLITHWCLPPGAHCQLGTSFGIIISSVSHHYLIIVWNSSLLLCFYTYNWFSFSI